MEEQVKPAQCKGCKAAIVWLTTVKGKKIPLDLEVTQGGAFEIDGNIAKYLGTKHDGPGHAAHFETCPQADSFRRKVQ